MKVKGIIFLGSLAIGLAFFHKWIGRDLFLNGEEKVCQISVKSLFSDTNQVLVNQDSRILTIRSYKEQKDSARPPFWDLYSLGDEQKKVFEKWPLNASDWAVVVHYFHKKKAPFLAIGTELSWEEGEELELSALDHEMSQIKTVVGIRLRRVAIQNTLPDYLKQSTIKASNIKGKITLLPEVNDLVFPPSTSGAKKARYGFLVLESESTPKIDEQGILKYPMLARWGKELIPSWPLAVLLTQLKLNPEDLEGELGKELKLGAENALVIPIDEFGRASVQITNKDLNGAQTTPLERIFETSSTNSSSSKKQGVIIYDQSEFQVDSNLPELMSAMSRISVYQLAHERKVPHVNSLLYTVGLGTIILLGVQFIRMKRGERGLLFLLLGLGCFLFQIACLDLWSHWFSLLPIATTLLLIYLSSFFLPKKKNTKRGRRRKVKENAFKVAS